MGGGEQKRSACCAASDQSFLIHLWGAGRGGPGLLTFIAFLLIAVLIAWHWLSATPALLP